MKKIDIEKICACYEICREKNLDGRYLNLDKMRPFLTSLGELFAVEKIGASFENRDIHKVVFGHGKTKVLLWTQMHGNESTGTRAFLDLLSFFTNPGEFTWLRDQILEGCTVHCIPMLNPDGAAAYTRVNAQGIDLNRDVLEKKAPESKLLQQVLHKVDPVYCFNLHDQRTIFSVKPDNKTATMSFLAPSVDPERSLTQGRIQTMKVIVAMNELLQQVIPGKVGRYTDEFYPTATGDNFQKMGYNTILIEAGHSKGDYLRYESRRATFISLLEGLRYMSGQEQQIAYQKYEDIPDNEKKYLDIIVKNVRVAGVQNDLGILYIEKLRANKIIFDAGVDKIDDLSDYNADEFIDGKRLEFAHKTDVEKWVKNKFN